MKHEIQPWLGALFAAGLWAASAQAQTPAKPVNIMPPGGVVQAHEEMEQLIGKVERRLQKVDRLLSDAGAGDVSALAQVGTSGLDELLKQSHIEARAAADDIDRILALADHQHSGGT